MADAKRKFTKCEIYFFEDNTVEVRLPAIDFVNYHRINDALYELRRKFQQMMTQAQNKLISDRNRATPFSSVTPTDDTEKKDG